MGLFELRRRVSDFTLTGLCTAGYPSIYIFDSWINCLIPPYAKFDQTIEESLVGCLIFAKKSTVMTDCNET